MKVFLDTLIARYFPTFNCSIKAFRGKQDLEKGITNFLRSWQVPDSKFIIVRDQDSWDCIRLKAELKAKCDAVRSGVIVRIACVELEAWYWGDLVAVECAFNRPNLVSLSRRRTYRTPDEIINPKAELRKHIPKYEQQFGAKAIAAYVDAERNTSHSFNVFFESLQTLANEI